VLDQRHADRHGVVPGHRAAALALLAHLAVGESQFHQDGAAMLAMAGHG
jgi:hypothetical protein